MSQITSQVPATYLHFTALDQVLRHGLHQRLEEIPGVLGERGEDDGELILNSILLLN